jgi:hypothetical protein
MVAMMAAVASSHFENAVPVMPVSNFDEVRDTDYGRREFGFVDEDGTLHRVGWGFG